MSQVISNKNLYKLFLSFLKFLPIILALSKILGLMLHCFGYSTLFLTLFSGTSVCMLGLLYILSYIFKFCILHRLSLHYITLVTLISTSVYYLKLPITTPSVIYIYTILSGLFIAGYVIISYINRNNPKIDHIKQLCESYVNCCE